MATTVTELTNRAVASNSYDALSTTVGIIVILALLVLLIEREAFAVSTSRDGGSGVGPVTGLVVALLAPWALIVSARVIDLL